MTPIIPDADGFGLGKPPNDGDLTSTKRNGQLVKHKKTEIQTGHRVLSALLSFFVCACCASGATSGGDDPLEKGKLAKLHVTPASRKKDVVVMAASLPKAVEKVLPVDGGEVFTIGDRPAFLILPNKARQGDRIPWVWYAPTLTGLPGQAEKWMFEQFLARGIAIGGVDVGESYGSPQGTRVYSALYDELVEKRGLARQACLLARSRGGLMLYNWAVENPESVACIAGIYPVCSLSSYPGLQRACGAFGMTKEQLAAKLAEHNPIDRLDPLAKAKVPIFHIHGDSDRVVPLDENSGEVKKRYDKLGGPMTLEVVEGQGHNMWPGWFNSQKLVDFVISNATKDKPT
jgi:predicted esterase